MVSGSLTDRLLGSRPGTLFIRFADADRLSELRNVLSGRAVLAGGRWPLGALRPLPDGLVCGPRRRRKRIHPIPKAPTGLCHRTAAGALSRTTPICWKIASDGARPRRCATGSSQILRVTRNLPPRLSRPSNPGLSSPARTPSPVTRRARANIFAKIGGAAARPLPRSETPRRPPSQTRSEDIETFAARQIKQRRRRAPAPPAMVRAHPADRHLGAARRKLVLIGWRVGCRKAPAADRFALSRRSDCRSICADSRSATSRAHRDPGRRARAGGRGHDHGTHRNGSSRSRVCAISAPQSPTDTRSTPGPRLRSQRALARRDDCRSVRGSPRRRPMASNVIVRFFNRRDMVAGLQ